MEKLDHIVKRGSAVFFEKAGPDVICKIIEGRDSYMAKAATAALALASVCDLWGKSWKGKE